MKKFSRSVGIFTFEIQTIALSDKKKKISAALTAVAQAK